jgi:hypothetical protein
MSTTHEATVQAKLFATDRRDVWWLGPLLTAMGLGAFGIYSTWAAFQGEHFRFGPYLSPMYSPLIQWDAWPFSPAILILWAPLGFRATCYYYRKAYYRAFFADPPGCAVGEHRGHKYRGETAFPFILQNLHRYFLYVALIFIVILWYDVFEAFFKWDDGSGGHSFGMGLGTLVMTVNTALLSGYTFGCHSLRHLVGGKLDCFSCTATGPARHGCWRGVSWFNRRHQLFAWCSLFSVGFTDFYIRMCSMGVFRDIRFF